MPPLPNQHYSPPTATYKGLTVVMSNPSRMDTLGLLSGNGGYFFTRECLYPQVSKMQCEIRLADNKRPLLPNTKGVLLLGERAAKEWLGNKLSAGDTLNMIRGTPYIIDGVVHIASYLPQEAVDPRADYEKKFNPWKQLDNSSATIPHSLLDDDKRHFGNTSPSNYAFWLKADTKKLLRIIIEQDGKLLPSTPSNYKIYPDGEEVIKLLSETKGQLLFFDMETTWEDRKMTCFAFKFGYTGTVYVVPVCRYDYSLAYDELTSSRILRAFCRAVADNTLVAHNGSGFDFIVLAMGYKIPITPNVQDTMLMQHRIYPCVEKSLGHCISLWTDEPFHKDEICSAFHNMESSYRLWQYCGKDVHTMALVHKAQLAFASTIPGMLDSINQVNESIYDYTLMTLMGMHYRFERVAAIMAENDRLMVQYLRVLKELVGRDFLPTSSPDCVKYFHDEMGYPVIARSKKTNRPSLGEAQLYKLALKHPTPVTNLVLLYRQTKTETGKLKFIPYELSTNNSNTTHTDAQSDVGTSEDILQQVLDG